MKRLEKENIQDMYALSPIQKGILLDYLKGEKSHYHNQTELHIQGAIDVERFQNACGQVGKQNEILRTVFRWENLQLPIQIVLRVKELPFQFYDCTHPDGPVYQDIKDNDKTNYFDIRQNAIRITLCQVQANQYYLIITNHHILYDGWSSGLLLEEIFTAYEKGDQQAAVKTKATNKQFITYIAEQSSETSKAYWRSYLQGFEGKTSFYTPNRAYHEITATHECSAELSQAMLQKIDALLKDGQCTIASLFNTAWGLLMTTCNYTDACMFGVTMATRPAEITGMQNTIGLFIDTLPLCFRTTSAQTCMELLVRTAGEMQSIYENRFLQHADLKRIADMPMQDNLFHTIVVVENYPLPTNQMFDHGNLQILGYTTHEVTPYDITVSVTIHDGVQVGLSVNADLFSLKMTERLLRSLVELVDTISSNPQTKVKDIVLLPAEQWEWLQGINQTSVAHSASHTLFDCFKQTAENARDKKALCFKDQWLSYGALLDRVNRWGLALQEKRNHTSPFIGIMADPSDHMITAVMAILSLSAAFVPIDPEWPLERIAYIVQDSGMNMVLTEEKYAGRIKSITPGIMTVTFEALSQVQANGQHMLLTQSGNPTGNQTPVYLLYTSGTTGKPKGVAASHKNVLNTVCWFNKTFDISIGKHVLLVTKYTCDPFIEDVFGSLLGGAALHIVDQQLLFSKDRFYRYLVDQQIYLLNYTPDMLNELLGDQPRPASLEILISGSDVLTEKVKNTFLSKGYQLYNNYGPTEVTVDALSAKCSEQAVTIGKPIDNTRCYITDRNQNPLFPGAVGEMWLSGDGVVAGYHNAPGMTEKKFMSLLGEEWAYRTGDMATWTEDGEVVYLGREDRQVKLRGFRVELAEIETALLEIEGIQQAAVIKSGNEKLARDSLHAVVVCEKSLVDEEIRQQLRKKLPSYMIPAYLIRTDKIPLTERGKRDDRALKALADDKAVQKEGGSETPEKVSKTEDKIIQIWKKTLQRNNISILDDFFEIGGDSLALIQVYSGLEKEFPSVYTVQDLFDNRTVKSLAKLIGDQEQGTGTDAGIQINKIDF